MNESPAEPMPEHVSFAPESPAAAPSRARRTGRAAAWVAVGAIGATVLTGVAFAATGGDSGSTSETPSAAPSGAPSGAPGDGRHGGGHGGPSGRGLFGGLGGDVLHGEYVVKDGDSTKTMLGQSGAVTAASSTSLTVKSTDGFVATWTLSSSTKVHGFALEKDGKSASVSDIKVGATVFVAGTKSSSTTGAATQVLIRPTAAQLKTLQENAPQGDHHGGRPGGSAPTPSASASSSSTGA